MTFRLLACLVLMAALSLPAAAGLLLMSGAAAPAGPTSGGAPTLSGTAAYPSTLTCTSGAWTPTAPPTTIQYQFFRNTSTSVQGPSGSGPSTTYAVQSADQGTSITCTAIGTNGGTTTSLASNAIAIPAAAAPTGSCTPSTNFFARVWALPATLDGPIPISGTGSATNHLKAYDDLICGLNTDGVWAVLDALWTPATQAATGSSQAVANLNLVSSSCTLVPSSASTTPVGPAPTFTPNQGYTGSAETASPGAYVDIGCALNTLTNYKLNAAHMMAWDFINYQGSSPGYPALIGVQDDSAGGAGVTGQSVILPRDSDNGALMDLNVSGVTSIASGGSSKGSNTATRWGAGTGNAGGVYVFKNGQNQTIVTGGSGSTAVPKIDPFLVANNVNGVAKNLGPHQIAAASIGAYLSPSTGTAPFVSSSNGLSGTGLIPRVCAYLAAVAPTLQTSCTP